MPERRTLLITYYWPPAAGPGVHRWLRFSRYWPSSLPPLTVVVPKNPAYPQTDPQLEKLVPADLPQIKVPIVEPASALKTKPGVAFAGGGSSFKSHLLAWIRGNFFIPDARVLWIRPLVNRLQSELQRGDIPLLITSGPPHSVHLAGLHLKRRFPSVFWVADFRDPWMEVDYLHHLRLSRFARRKHQKLEKSVLINADLILTISEGLRGILASKTIRPVTVIPNSFDPEWFAPVTGEEAYPKSFTLVHTGTMPAERDAPELWEALAAFPHPASVRLVGSVDPQVIQSAVQQGVQECIHVEPAVPHSEALKIQKAAALLLVVANRTPTASGILTGKVFEYLASGRPLLAIGPEDGDLHQLIRETQAGWFVPYGDAIAARRALEEAYWLWQQGRLMGKAEAVGAYSSANVIQKLADVLGQLGFKG